jgi:hypothetical protein
VLQARAIDLGTLPNSRAGGAAARTPVLLGQSHLDQAKPVRVHSQHIRLTVSSPKSTLQERTLADTEDLLREIRDLLVPIAEHYRPEFETTKAERRRKLKQDVSDLVASPKRRAAWDLIDGNRTQRQISQQSTLDEGSTSKLFKTLRDLGAIVYEPNPTKKVEID